MVVMRRKRYRAVILIAASAGFASLLAILLVGRSWGYTTVDVKSVGKGLSPRTNWVEPKSHEQGIGWKCQSPLTNSAAYGLIMNHEKRFVLTVPR